MTEIVSTVQEIDLLEKEIKVLKTNLYKLIKRKKELESKIITFLDHKDQPGLKYKDITIISEEKDRHKRLKKSDRLDKGVHILRKYGVSNPEEALKDLMTNLKGDAIPYKTVKIKKDKTGK
jgi:hypothetical protein